MKPDTTIDAIQGHWISTLAADETTPDRLFVSSGLIEFSFGDFAQIFDNLHEFTITQHTDCVKINVDNYIMGEAFYLTLRLLGVGHLKVEYIEVHALAWGKEAEMVRP